MKRALALLAVAAATVEARLPPAARCPQAVSAAVAHCTQLVARRVRACYLTSGRACGADDARVTAALTTLRARVAAACPDAATVQAGGYGPFFDPQSLAARAVDACLGDVSTLVARTFGGPHAAVLASVDGAGRRCLETAYIRSAGLLKQSVRLQSACITAARTRRRCDPARLDARLAALGTKTEAAVAAVCPDLGAAIGLTPARLVARTAAQARCQVAMAHPAPGPLALDCGPRPAAPPPPRGAWTRIVLDGSVWGTRCGDGSPYAFWLRLAPAGSPVERVLVNLAGGGACIFGADCARVSSSLFRATDDVQPSGGHLNTTAAVNPFHDWTFIHLPYCTQDLHVGGGATNVFAAEGVTVHRFGGVNARAGLHYLRDVIWATLDREDRDGYRPDRLRVLFAGESAGAFGVQYGYHYLLDELRWSRTSAVPDSGLALNNGEVLGVAGLGLIMGMETGIGWASRPYQPPYCQANPCAVGPVLQAASSLRLGVVPEQAFLNVSNQVDTTQASTTYFASTASWVNALRSAYCETRGLPGVRSFLPARPSSLHTVLRSNSLFATLTAGGQALRDWLAAAVADPAAVVDRVDEGELTSRVPGVRPFACGPGSAAGAFVL